MASIVVGSGAGPLGRPPGNALSEPENTMKQLVRPSLLAAMALLAVLPLSASAQSSLDSSSASAFLGSWALALDSPQGEFVLDLEIVDMDGKVGASIGSDMMGGSQEVTDISVSGGNLVLRYEIDAQGQMAPVALTLTPAGDALEAEMDFANGMFTMSGRATK